jgi:transposase
VRERLVRQRTGIINQIRAFLLERGIAIRQGLRFLRTELPVVLAERADALSPRMMRIIEELAGDWRRLDERIEGLSVDGHQHTGRRSVCRAQNVADLRAERPDPSVHRRCKGVSGELDVEIVDLRLVAAHRRRAEVSAATDVDAVHDRGPRFGRRLVFVELRFNSPRTRSTGRSLRQPVQPWSKNCCSE